MTAVKLVTQETLTDCGLACVAMVSGKSLEAVRKIAVKELGYPKDGPYTTTHDNLYKLLAHFGIGHGKKAPFKSLAAMPALAIMETRKMPSTGNSHLVVFERLPDGDERVLDPGFWLKQQERRDWNRIKLDTFVPVYLDGKPETAKKPAQKGAKTPVDVVQPEEVAAVAKKTKTTKPIAVKATEPKAKSTGKAKSAKTADAQEAGEHAADIPLAADGSSQGTLTDSSGVGTAADTDGQG